MDNQKSNEGSAREAGRDNTGSMGKDMDQSSQRGGTGSGSSASGGSPGAGNMGSASSGSMGSSASGSASSGSGSAMGRSPGSMGYDMEKGVERKASELHKTIDKAAGAAQPAMERMASGAHEGVDKLSHALSGASERMSEKSRQLSEAAKHFAETGREYVRSSPGTAVMGALAAGYLLSKILGRRHH
ncbi:DUF883 family protein [Massilia cavernae]|uniref:DUF883 domain-containing protein n=1 Tax=Massilia cavernae TaxID=2320864 RepID=A0A418Y6W4_9BURK|nr:hypothetical protein [Massilia cavernae]RJG23936.1 hypothetical protein D3872_03865 [Massilia cavernae]